jgi:hypothetical protein
MICVLVWRVVVDQNIVSRWIIILFDRTQKELFICWWWASRSCEGNKLLRLNSYSCRNDWIVSNIWRIQMNHKIRDVSVTLSLLWMAWMRRTQVKRFEIQIWTLTLICNIDSKTDCTSFTPCCFQDTLCSLRHTFARLNWYLAVPWPKKPSGVS